MSALLSLIDLTAVEGIRAEGKWRCHDLAVLSNKHLSQHLMSTGRSDFHV